MCMIVLYAFEIVQYGYILKKESFGGFWLFQGTWYVYEAMLRPFVERHETDIERSLKELRSKAWDVAIYYWHNSTELGQTKIFEIFQYLVDKPSSRPEVSSSIY